MGAEEPGLTPKIVASILMEVKVYQLGEKFGFVMGICLEIPGDDEHITKETTMTVALHEKSLNVSLKIPMLSTMANLLQWYKMCPV